MISIFKLLLCIGILLIATPAHAKLTLTSTAFKDGTKIPKKYTCDGQDLSPQLRWTGEPSGTKSFALIVHDPDAPDPKAPKNDWVHWIVLNIPANVHELAEGVLKPIAPAVACTNDFDKTEYGGPCPPIGEHRYFFKLYALSDTVQCPPGKVNVKKFETQVEKITLDSAQLMGTYEKK